MFAHRGNLMPTLRSSPRTSALLLLLATSVVTHAQVRQGLCNDGFGAFQTSFFGIKVSVGGARRKDLRRGRVPRRWSGAKTRCQLCRRRRRLISTLWASTSDWSLPSVQRL